MEIDVGQPQGQRRGREGGERDDSPVSRTAQYRYTGEPTARFSGRCVSGISHVVGLLVRRQ